VRLMSRWSRNLCCAMGFTSAPDPNRVTHPSRPTQIIVQRLRLQGRPLLHPGYHKCSTHELLVPILVVWFWDSPLHPVPTKSHNLPDPHESYLTSSAGRAHHWIRATTSLGFMSHWPRSCWYGFGILLCTQFQPSHTSFQTHTIDTSQAQPAGPTIGSGLPQV